MCCSELEAVADERDARRILNSAPARIIGDGQGVACCSQRCIWGIVIRLPYSDGRFYSASERRRDPERRRTTLTPNDGPRTTPTRTTPNDTRRLRTWTPYLHRTCAYLLRRNMRLPLDQTANIAAFFQIVTACETRGVKVASNGCKFICPVPSMGPLGFLHTLYPTCKNDSLENMSELFEFPLPGDYASFMRLHNGASLFSHTISLFGWVDNFSRSIRDEDQAAISIADKCELFRATSNFDWKLGWRPVGSVVANNRHHLMINPLGIVRFRSASGQERFYDSFMEMLRIVLSSWSSHFTCDGFVDHNYDDLEITAERLASNTN